VLPTLARGCGPYRKGRGGWINKPEDPMQQRAAASLYAALMTDAMLELISARSDLLIEGRFAGAELFVRAVATLRPDLRVYAPSVQRDVAQGALRLVYPSEARPDALEAAVPLNLDLQAYRTSWRAEAEKAEARA
jgi:carbohydrate kinase of FGGY family protein